MHTIFRINQNNNDYDNSHMLLEIINSLLLIRYTNV